MQKPWLTWQSHIGQTVQSHSLVYPPPTCISIYKSTIAIFVSLVMTNFVNSVSGVLDEICYVYSLDYTL
jgi:hypothetical protein